MRSILPISGRRRAAAAIVAVLLLAAPHALSAAKRPIAETDLFKFVWIADPRISPDGRQVVYVRVTVNEKKDGYDTALWIVAGGRQRAAAAVHQRPCRLLARAGRRTARGSPSSARSKRTARASRRRSILLSTRGGEAVALTDLPQGAGRAALVAGQPDDRLRQHAEREGLRKWRAKAKESRRRGQEGEGRRRTRRPRRSTRATCG